MVPWVAAVDVVSDPRAPKITHVLEPETILKETGLSWPHTSHCLGDGTIVIRSVHNLLTHLSLTVWRTRRTVGVYRYLPSGHKPCHWNGVEPLSCRCAAHWVMPRVKRKEDSWSSIR